MPMPRALEGLIAQLPMGPLRRLVRRDFVSVLYHVVSERRLPYVEHLYAFKTPAQFEDDLLYLKRHWALVGHDEIVAHLEGRAQLPPNAMQVTFDDGFSECFSVVRPLLLEHEVPCTFFIVSGLMGGDRLMFRNKISLCFGKLAEAASSPSGGSEIISSVNVEFGVETKTLQDIENWLGALNVDDEERIDAACVLLGADVAEVLESGRPYMTREEIVTLHEEGFTIGAHTLRHPRLWLLPSFEDVEREIVDSCEDLCALTGQSSVPLAFPFNGIKLSRGELRGLRERNKCVGLLYDTNYLTADAEFVVNRIPGDEPAPAGSRSGIEWAVKRAHVLEPLRAVKRRLRPATA